MLGSNWLCQRSRHCFPFRPSKNPPIVDHFLVPKRWTNIFICSSSSLVHLRTDRRFFLAFTSPLPTRGFVMGVLGEGDFSPSELSREETEGVCKLISLLRGGGGKLLFWGREGDVNADFVGLLREVWGVEIILRDGPTLAWMEGGASPFTFLLIFGAPVLNCVTGEWRRGWVDHLTSITSPYLSHT